jgi:hypothetical protein
MKKELLYVLFLFVVACNHDASDIEDTTPNTLYVTNFSLPNEESVLYEKHSFQYIIGIAGTDSLESNTKIIANVFLVDSNADAEVDSGEGKPTCFVGSIEIQLVIPGEDVVVAGEGRPDEDCYDPDSPQELFSFAVLLESNNTLLSNEQLNDDNYIVLTEPMRTKDVNQLCIGDDNIRGCVKQLTVEASPGIDIELSGLTLESNIVLNYSRELSAHNSYDEMHTANTEVTLEAWAEGLSLQQQSIFQEDNIIHIEYAMKPVGFGQDWLPLTVQQSGNMSPVNHNAREPINRISDSAENHFVDSLFIEGETYAAVGPGGVWEGEYQFEMRACLILDFVEADVPTDVEDLNNCFNADFFLTERLIYNPDIYADDDETRSVEFNKKLSLRNDKSQTTDKGLYKKLDVRAGDADALEIGMSFINQARFGVVSIADEITGSLKPGSGIPFASFGSTLEAHLDGFIDAELVLIDFSHTLTHKDATDDPDWKYNRSYKPSVMLHLFGQHFVDINGSLPLNGKIDINNEDLEKIKKLFVKDDDGEPVDDNKISFAQDMCTKTLLTALVAEVNVHSCITSHSGVDYGITLEALDADSNMPFVGPFIDAESLISATVWIDPFAELDWKGGVEVDLGLLKGDLDINVALMKLHLTHMDSVGEFQKGASFTLTSGAINEFEILGSIETEAYLQEEILNGEIVFDGKRVKGLTIKCCFYPKATWKSLKKSLYSWDGIIIGRQKLWNLDVSDVVKAEDMLIPNVN